MKKVSAENNVLLYLDELITTLFKKEYFGFVESAEEYVNKIYDFMYDEASYTHHRETKSEYIHFGKCYIVYKANKHTSWLIFFEKIDERILVTYITNNHTEEYAKVFR